MSIGKGLSDWVVSHNGNLALVAGITLACPGWLLEALLRNNLDKEVPWKQKKSALTISFDCDYAADAKALPHVLKLLSQFSLRASFACVGHWIEQYPREHAMILEYGHEIMNHTYSHPDNEFLNPGRKFKDIPRAEKKEEIEKCHEVCRKVLNYEPSGCRIPHFKNLFTPEIYGILKEIGYSYSSSTWLTNTPSYGMPFFAEAGILEFPLTTCPKHPFTVFDTWHSLHSRRLIHSLIHWSQGHYIALAKHLVDIAVKNSAYLNIYIDPYDIVKMEGFSSVLEYVTQKKDDIWVATYQEIAAGMKQAAQ